MEHLRRELDQDATAIMLRRLPSRLRTDSLLEILEEISPGGYDFVYMPHEKNKNRNVALAFVNFVDNATAQKAFQYFARPTHQALLGSSPRVSQADIQGLEDNLAYFVARFGMQEVDNPHAPRVFENGVRQNILEAVTKRVNMEMLAKASERMKQLAPVQPKKALLSRHRPQGYNQHVPHGEALAGSPNQSMTTTGSDSSVRGVWGERVLSHTPSISPPSTRTSDDSDSSSKEVQASRTVLGPALAGGSPTISPLGTAPHFGQPVAPTFMSPPGTWSRVVSTPGSQDPCLFQVKPNGEMIFCL